MFTQEDEAYLNDYEILVETAKKQRETLINGIPFMQIITPATIGNGVEKYNETEQNELFNVYEQVRENGEIVKFVPASGAATRMFKHLSRFLEEYDPEKELINTYLCANENTLIKEFFENTKEFAFSNLVQKKIRKQFPDFKKMKKGPRFQAMARVLLKDRGLGYADLPKGLIPFHKYIKYATTAFEEQLYETAFYCATNEGVKIHFTFAEQHVDKFSKVYEKVKKRVVKKTKTNFIISYSFQKKETNTIAIDQDLNLVRTAKGDLLLRPSGHGALLTNLNEIDADIIFIKNIDNVVCEKFVPEIAHHKKVLAGKLVILQRQIFKYMEQLDDGADLNTLNEIKSFIWNSLHCKSKPETVAQVRSILDRPLRVCGVVKNTGAPGGGPYWVRSNNENTLQIVETAQIDMEISSQRNLLEEATHFNPVDLVCGVRDYQGNKFNLHDFKDTESGFVTKKSYNGNTIKALELPGLWNGAMANWNTIFVEVPLSTFNPVKTVNDLLKIEHRPLA